MCITCGGRAKPGRTLCERHLEILSASSRRKRLADPTRLKANKRRSLYGLTPVQHRELLDAQGGRCAICRCLSPSGGKTLDQWSVDHDHKTGAIRGLLCHHCNSGLGNFNDNQSILWSAIDYLRRAAIDQMLGVARYLPVRSHRKLSRSRP